MSQLFEVKDVSTFQLHRQSIFPTCDAMSFMKITQTKSKKKREKFEQMKVSIELAIAKVCSCTYCVVCSRHNIALSVNRPTATSILYICVCECGCVYLKMVIYMQIKSWNADSM